MTADNAYESGNLANERLSLADILQMYDKTEEEELTEDVMSEPAEEGPIHEEPTVSTIIEADTEPKKEEKFDNNKVIVEESIMSSNDYNENKYDQYSIPSLIITTPSRQYDLNSQEEIAKLSQEIKDYISELEQQLSRLQRSWTASKQIRKTYTALEEAARHDASSDEIIKMGERLALLKDAVKTETPTKEELSNLIMKLETTRSIFARYIDILRCS